MAEEAEATETTEEASPNEVSESPEWVSSIQDEGLRTALSGFESSDAALKAIGVEVPEAKEVDWREQITDEDVKKFAESSTDLNHLGKRALDMRQKLSKAIFLPDKKSSKEDVAAFNKALGIPDSPEGYAFPELPEAELTDDIKASREAWAGRFHSLNVSTEAASKLMEFVREDAAKHTEAQIAADKAFAAEQEKALKSEWKGDDYEKNKALANRALSDIAGRANIKLEDLTHMETKDGHFLLDNANILRVFAALGREMSEGTLGPVLSEGESETLQGEVEKIREQIAEAQDKGNSKKANALFAKEQALLAKIHGDGPVVGAETRTV